MMNVESQHNVVATFQKQGQSNLNAFPMYPNKTKIQQNASGTFPEKATYSGFLTQQHEPGAATTLIACAVSS